MHVYNQEGNSVVIGVVIVVILLGLGGWFLSQNSNDSQAPADTTVENTMMEDESATTEEDTMMPVSSSQDGEGKDDAMMEEGSMNDQDSMMKNEDVMMAEDEDVLAQVGSYVDYSETAYADNKDKKRVLFFHASWCPTCRAANSDFLSSANSIPAGVVIFKTDYDTQNELKEKYDITYQHTFVQVDAEGNAVKKWNGGGVDELVDNVL